jgi:hypothetical protein
MHKTVYGVISKEELKYTDKLTTIEREFINERKFDCCTPCWIKYLRPVFISYFVYASDCPASTERYIFYRYYATFDKCTHGTPTFIPR